MLVTTGHLLYEGAYPRRATLASCAAAQTGPAVAPYPSQVSPAAIAPRTQQVRTDGYGVHLQAAQCGLHLQPAARTSINPCRMNTYAKCAANPRGMNTYKIIGLKVSCNQHLRKNRGGGGVIVTQHPLAARSPRQIGRRSAHGPAGRSLRHNQDRNREARHSQIGIVRMKQHRSCGETEQTAFSTPPVSPLQAGLFNLWFR
jgi:hypothetical protein